MEVVSAVLMSLEGGMSLEVTTVVGQVTETLREHV